MPDVKRVGSGELFPTDEPVSGEALVGRGDDVDAIASALLGSINTVLAGPRRLGKTSVARAALEICRARRLHGRGGPIQASPTRWQLAESLTVERAREPTEGRQLSPGRDRRPRGRGRSPR